MTFNATIAPGGWLIDLTRITGSEVRDDFIIYNNEDQDTSIALCVYLIGDEKGTDAEKAEIILADMYDAGSGESHATETIYCNTQIAGKAIIYYCINKENNDTFWLLEGVKIKGNQYLLSQIFYPTEEYKAWAIKVWNSIIKLEEN